MKILFICKHNRFRSKVAASYFNKTNVNKRNKAKSIGLIKSRPLSKNEVKIAKKLGIGIKGKSKGLNEKILNWQDIIVVVADDVPTSIFKNEKWTKK